MNVCSSVLIILAFLTEQFNFEGGFFHLGVKQNSALHFGADTAWLIRVLSSIMFGMWREI